MKNESAEKKVPFSLPAGRDLLATCPSACIEIMYNTYWYQQPFTYSPSVVAYLQRQTPALTAKIKAFVFSVVCCMLNTPMLSSVSSLGKSRGGGMFSMSYCFKQGLQLVPLNPGVSRRGEAQSGSR